MLPAGSMNRRILLIDADSAFHTSVAKQLARFRFDILHEPDGDRAHALPQKFASRSAHHQIPRADSSSAVAPA